MNKARCRNCKDVIESKWRHDWTCCSCFTGTENNTGIFIDGGEDYRRYGGNLDNFERLEE